MFGMQRFGLILNKNDQRLLQRGVVRGIEAARQGLPYPAPSGM